MDRDIQNILSLSHGAGMTANVITYRPRSATRDMGKVLGFAAEQIDRLAKLLSRHEFIDPDESLEKYLRDAGFHPDDRRVRHLVRLVHEIQNLPRRLPEYGHVPVAANGYA